MIYLDNAAGSFPKPPQVGKAMAEALARTGQYIEGEIKRKIGSGPFTPNSPATIRKKKSSKPLIDTGHMRQSVRYEIGDRSDE